MNRAIEAFEREFAPWALKLPAADVAARQAGSLRAHGWSVLYEFGTDAYGEYLDYYAALRDGSDERVNDDWHARIYATGTCVAFPAVLEAYLYARDPSPDELERARGPVLASLAPPPPAPVEASASLGTADTALWEDLREVVEAEAPPKVAEPVRPAAETPAEIDSVLSEAFREVEKPAPEAVHIEEEQEEEPEKIEQPVEEPAPRRSAQNYDPFIELRSTEPKSFRRPAPANDDFRPYWQRYPARTAGVAAAVAVVLLVGMIVLGRGGSSKSRARTETASAAPSPSTSSAAAPAADTDVTAREDTQTVAPPDDPTPDTASSPAPPPAPMPVSSSESSVARPFGPSNVPQIMRTDGSGASPSTSHRFARPTAP